MTLARLATHKYQLYKNPPYKKVLFALNKDGVIIIVNKEEEKKRKKKNYYIHTSLQVASSTY
jgi:transcription initiation factor IIE alpha subunit